MNIYVQEIKVSNRIDFYDSVFQISVNKVIQISIARFNYPNQIINKPVQSYIFLLQCLNCGRPLARKRRRASIACAKCQRRRKPAKRRHSVAVTMESPRQKGRLAKDVPRYRHATRPSTVVARTVYLQQLVQRTKVVPSRTARRRCSVVVPTELPLPRATTWRDARNSATKRS